MATYKYQPHCLTVALLTILLTTFGSPASAQTQEPGWQLRLRGVIVDGHQAFSTEDASGSQVLAGGNAALGVGAAIEYRFSNRLGLELGAAFADIPDYEGDGIGTSGRTEIGEGPSFAPITASLNIHLTPDRRVDVYVAPTIAFVKYGDFALDLGDGAVPYDTEDDVAWGGTIGFDLGFGDGPWAFNAAATYLSSDMEISERGSSQTVVVPFDPVMVQLGVTFSF